MSINAFPVPETVTDVWIRFADEQKHVAEAGKNYTIPSNIITIVQQIQIPEAATVAIDSVIKFRNIDQYDFTANVPSIFDYDLVGPPAGTPTASKVAGNVNGFYALSNDSTGAPAVGKMEVWTLTSTADDWIIGYEISDTPQVVATPSGLYMARETQSYTASGSSSASYTSPVQTFLLPNDGNYRLDITMHQLISLGLAGDVGASGGTFFWRKQGGVTDSVLFGAETHAYDTHSRASDPIIRRNSTGVMSLTAGTYEFWFTTVDPVDAGGNRRPLSGETEIDIFGHIASVDPIITTAPAPDPLTYVWQSRGGTSWSAPPAFVAPRDMIVRAQFAATGYQTTPTDIWLPVDLAGGTLISNDSITITFTNEINSHKTLTPAIEYYRLTEGATITPQFGTMTGGSDLNDMFTIDIVEVSVPIDIAVVETIAVDDYVITERATGRKWLDGKPIYSQGVDGLGIAVGTPLVVLPAGTVDSLCDSPAGSIQAAGVRNQIPLFFDDGTNTTRYWIGSDGSVKLTTNWATASKTVHAVFYYTKP